jgi:hypothetical protein
MENRLFFYGHNPKLLAFILLILLITSCTKNSVMKVINDGGVISQKPCSPPCFLGIVPGITNRSYAIDELKKKGIKGYVEKNSALNYFDLLYLQYDQNFLIYEINFIPSANILIGEIIKIYGEPDTANVTYDPSSRPEHNYFEMEVYYDSLQSIFVLERQENWPGFSVTRETKVIRIIYGEESVYEGRKRSTSHIVNWKGYAIYSDPNPGYFP